MDYRPILAAEYDISATNFPYYDYGDQIFQYKLLLKQHYETGISYLCITKQDNYEKYTGSGKRWKKLLSKIPSRLITTLLYTTDDKDELVVAAAFHSLLYNIPKNPDFANIIPELGYEFNQGNLPEWVRNATPEQLEMARTKQSVSIKKTNDIKRLNGEIFGIELANQKLFTETGLINFMQIPEVADKCHKAWVKSMIDNYGVENIMELEEYSKPARLKAEITMLERYGVSNISQTPGFKERVGPNISAGLLAKPIIKCTFCDLETRNIGKHEKECKLNPNRIPLATTVCEFCDLEVINGNYKRWHGINCKHNPNKGN